MNDPLNDLEAGLSSTIIPRQSNKKMRKRKQLNNLLKFRVTKTDSNDILRSSEDELFLPQQRTSIMKSHSSRYCGWWKYSHQILSFILVGTFMITCFGLIYANIELKNEVQDLSLRIHQIDKKISNIELQKIVSTIDQIKVRLNILEHWNLSLIYNQLQKLQLHMLLNAHDANLVNNQPVERRSTPFAETTKTLDNEIQHSNQSIQMQEWMTRLDQLFHFVHNSSDKTSVILTKFQSHLDQLQRKIDQCTCVNASIHTKPSVVGNDQVQPNTISSSTKLMSTIFKKVNDENTQTENDVEQIVNQRSV